MRAVTTVGELTLDDLSDIADGRPNAKFLSDMDFLQTLADRKCILVPPWIVRLHPDGGMERLLHIHYDRELSLDKARILFNVLESLDQWETGPGHIRGSDSLA